MADPRSIAKALGPWFGLLLLAIVFVVSRSVCIGTWLADGIVTDECPDGRVRPTLAVDGNLRRGTEGALHVRAIGHFTTGPADQDLTAPIRRFRPVAILRTQGGAETPLDLDWRATAPGTKEAKVTLPADLTDGEHELEVRAVTAAGDASTTVALSVFAPAKVHVLTDRPLYQPGDTVQLRSVVFRAADLVPLGARPGRFRITDPNGDLLLDERADADAWAVASRSFPIDPLAAIGDWTVSWASGDARGDARFRVEPFELPRFRIEAHAEAPFYRVGETPRVGGGVTYSSGAPVAGADLAIDWDSDGDWPIPTAWLQGDLPTTAAAGDDGRFALVLPDVPADLVGQATLRAAVTATDLAGDRVAGSFSVLLSEDAIQIQTLTELPGGGLVQGFNNRLYLRATTADGRTLDGVDLRVDKAWDPSDEPIVAKTDEDGVASIQVDPGPPVTVLVPAMPLRPSPLPPAVSLADARDMVGGADLSLADRRELDRWLAVLRPCARYIEDSGREVALGVHVAPSGGVRSVSAGATALERCAARALGAQRLSVGGDRVLALRYAFQPPDLPRFRLVSIEGQPWTPPELSALVAERLLDARACLSPTVPSGQFPWVLTWTGKRQSRALALAWAATEESRDTSLACVAGRFAGLVLDQPAQSDGGGVVHLRVQAAPTREIARPSPTTMLGYELDARAMRGDEEIGRTRIRLPPGAVPPLRLRLDPPIAAPGDELALEILRGPEFSGELPKKLALVHDQSKPIEADVKDRKARFVLPDDAAGWYAVQWNGAQAFAYVPESGELTVTLTPAEPTLRPGAMGSLTVRTEAAGKGVEAAVAIIGVDESLGQLVPLPGPDALDGLRLLPPSQGAAFPSLDVGALTMGRIRGANARAATVLRVSALPSATDRDAWVAVRAEAPFDTIGPLTDAFYTVLAALHAHVRAWEQSAEPGKMLELDAYAKLWDRALDEVESADDAFGRKLALARLPDDLLALCDPRQVVIDGTRLSEDVEPWIPWVRGRSR
jgi:hypothetical protein